MHRRHVLQLAMLAAAAAACGRAREAWAQQSFQRFFPFLIDLPGWKGGTPDGISMDMPGNRMMTAMREYQRGDQRLSAQVVTGPAAEGALAITQSPVKIETNETRMSTATLDGMAVARTFNIPDKSGAVVVALAPSAMFSLSFTGVEDDEGFALARRFDWKRIQAAAR